MLQKLRNILPMDKSDMLLFAGSASLFYGTYKIYPPSAFISTGIILLAVSVIQARLK